MKQIVSDNGTNLVGACNELKQALKDWDITELMKFHSNQGISWSFNTPAASHQGGVSERQIRTIRKILQAILNEQHLRSCHNEEELQTLMCEVEAIINGRPLTQSSDDPNNLGVITPNDLLLMKAGDPPPGKFNPEDVYARRRCSTSQMSSGDDGCGNICPPSKSGKSGSSQNAIFRLETSCL